MAHQMFLILTYIRGYSTILQVSQLKTNCGLKYYSFLILFYPFERPRFEIRRIMTSCNDVFMSVGVKKPPKISKAFLKSQAL